MSGRVNAITERSQPSSLNTAASSAFACARQWLTHAGLIGAPPPLAARSRAAARRASPRSRTACHRISIAARRSSANGASACASASRPSSGSPASATSTGKLLMGTRWNSGSAPTAMIFASQPAFFSSIIHGTSASTVMTTSASASHASGSPPACIGWSVAITFRAAQKSITGSAKRSAKSARTRQSLCAGSRWAMITGFLASRTSAAAAVTASPRGAPALAGWSRVASGGVGGRRRRQHLARQAEIHRPGGVAAGDRQRPLDHRFRLLRIAQLVVPLDRLAHHRRLVAHLLAPVDRPRAAAVAAALGDRRAPGAHQDRNVVGGCVEETHQRVGETDVDVHHGRLRPPGRQVVPVRHADRDRFVRHQHRPRQRLAGARARTPR